MIKIPYFLLRYGILKLFLFTFGLQFKQETKFHILFSNTFYAIIQHTL